MSNAALVKRKRVFVTVLGGKAHNVTQKLRSAAAGFVTYDAHVVEMITMPPAQHKFYTNVELPMLYPVWLFPDAAEVTVVCEKELLGKVHKHKTVLFIDHCDDDDDDGYDSSDSQSAHVTVMRKNLQTESLDSVLRNALSLVSQSRNGNVYLTPRENAAWLRVRDYAHQSNKPWLTRLEFESVVNCDEAARHIMDQRCVAALSSAFVAVNLAWLFDSLRCIRVPACYSISCANFMWHALCVDRLLERRLLDVLWPCEHLCCCEDVAPQLRSALVDFFEHAAVLGPRMVAPAPPCQDMWLVFHIVWCAAAVADDDDTNVRGWQVMEPVRHCVRRRIAIAEGTDLSALFRGVLLCASQLERVDLSVSLTWIKAASLDDAEHVVVLVRAEASETPQRVFVDVLSWYPERSRHTDMVHRVFHVLMPCIEETCKRQQGVAVVVEPSWREDLSRPCGEKQTRSIAQISWRSCIDWRDITEDAASTRTLREAVCSYHSGKTDDACKPIGKGGFGAVWRGVWRGRDVAVKAAVTAEHDVDALRLEEFSIMMDVRAHVNVVQLLGFCVAPAAIVMEFIQSVDGKSTLSQWIQNADFAAVPLSRLAQIALQVNTALAYIHSMHILHCDVKASNVLMSYDSGTWVPKLSDFGVSARLTSVNGKMQCVKGHVVGTRGLQAPEQALFTTWNPCSDQKEFVFTEKADIWTFGMLLLRIFCGSDNSASVTVVVKNALERIERKCRLLRCDDTFHLNALCYAVQMRNSSLFAKAKRRRQLCTPALVLAEWCQRPQPHERPTCAEISAVLHAMCENFVAAEARGVADAWLVDDDADADDDNAPLVNPAEEFVRQRRLRCGQCSTLAQRLWKSALEAWQVEVRRSTAAEAAADTRAFNVFSGLPCRFLVQEICRCAGSDADSASVTQLLDASNVDIVSLPRLEHCLEGCDSAADIVAKALKPVFFTPALPPGPPLVGYGEELDAVCQQLLQIGREPTPQHVLAVAGARGTGKTRFVLEVAHKLHSAHPAAFGGGIVYASVLCALSEETVFDALCRAVHIDAESHAAFPRWCARQSARGNVLLVVDGSTHDVVDVALHMHRCLHSYFHLQRSWAAGDAECSELEQQSSRVFVLVAGALPPSAKAHGVLMALETQPRIVAQLRGGEQAIHPRMVCDFSRGSFACDNDRVAALWRTLPRHTRNVLTRLSAWRAPFDMDAAAYVCSCDDSELAPQLDVLVRLELLSRTSKHEWCVGDANADAVAALADAAFVDAARAAFVCYYCAVLAACVDEHHACENSGWLRFEAARQSLRHLLQLAKAAVSQSASVRGALAHIASSRGVAVMKILETRMDSCINFEACCALWLSAWLMPRTPRNARSLAAVSLCFARTCYFKDAGEDGKAAAEFGLELMERVTKTTLTGAHALHTVQRDGESVADAMSVLSLLLNDNKDAEEPCDVALEHKRLMADAAERLRALRVRFPGSQRLQSLQLDCMPNVAEMCAGHKPRQTRALLLQCRCLITLALYVDTLHHKTTAEWYQLGTVLSDCDLKLAAIAAYERAKELELAAGLPHSPRMACTLSSTAVVWCDMKHYAKALELYKQCATIRRLVLGATHCDVARTLSFAAIALHHMGKHQKALRKFEKSHDIRRDAWGIHFDVASTLNNIGIVMKALKASPHDTARVNERCFLIRRELLGFMHPEVAQTLSNLSICWLNLGMRERALQTMHRCLEINTALNRAAEAAQNQFKIGIMQIDKPHAQKSAMDALLESLKMHIEHSGVAHKDVRIAVSSITSAVHKFVTHSSLGLVLRSVLLDRQLQILNDIAFDPAQAPPSTQSQFRYAVDALQLARRLPDADVATTMAGIGCSLLAVLSTSAAMPYLLHAACKSAVCAVVVSELQVRERVAEPDARNLRDAALAHNNAGCLFLKRGQYDDAAAEFSRAAAQLRQTQEQPQAMYIDALLGYAEAVVRTDCLNAFSVYKLAWQTCTAADRTRLRHNFVLLRQRLLTYADNDDEDEKDDHVRCGLLVRRMSANLLELELAEQSAVCEYLKARGVAGLVGLHK